MKKLITILLFSFLSFPLFCQKFEFEPPLFYEYYYSQPEEGIGTFQFVYRINFDRLSFLKDGEKYTTKIRVTIELQDSLTNNISRANEDKSVSVSEFDETINRNRSVQGLLDVDLQEKKYFLTITLTDLQTNKDFSFPPLSVDLSSHETKCYVVSTGTNGKYYLANRGKTVPFAPSAYSLIYQQDSVKTDSLCLKFQSPVDSLKSCSSISFDTSFLLEEDSSGIYLVPQAKTKAKSFLFQDVSLKLPEGRYALTENKGKPFPFAVKWWDKPRSLMNYDIALKALGIVETPAAIDSLRSSSSKIAYYDLFKFWRKYDPTPNTTYNELMAEFYSRTDYAQKTYSNFTMPDGISSARGKIYIQFGPPTTTEKISSVNGRNLEIWYYKERNQKYFFRDNTGNGNYELVKE